VSETVTQYDQHFWRMIVFDDSTPATQEKYFSLLEHTGTHNELFYVGPREKDAFRSYLNRRLRDARLEGIVKNLFRPLLRQRGQHAAVRRAPRGVLGAQRRRGLSAGALAGRRVGHRNGSIERDALNVRGAGLALLLIHDVCTALGGALEVRSRTGACDHGTTVRMTFAVL
jgi:hypothetical protein